MSSPVTIPGLGEVPVVAVGSIGESFGPPGFGSDDEEPIFLSPIQRRLRERAGMLGYGGGSISMLSSLAMSSLGAGMFDIPGASGTGPNRPRPAVSRPATAALRQAHQGLTDLHNRLQQLLAPGAASPRTSPAVPSTANAPASQPQPQRALLPPGRTRPDPGSDDTDEEESGGLRSSGAPTHSRSGDSHAEDAEEEEDEEEEEEDDDEGDEEGEGHEDFEEAEEDYTEYFDDYDAMWIDGDDGTPVQAAARPGSVSSRRQDGSGAGPSGSRGGPAPASGSDRGSSDGGESDEVEPLLGRRRRYARRLSSFRTQAQGTSAASAGASGSGAAASTGRPEPSTVAPEGGQARSAEGLEPLAAGGVQMPVAAAAPAQPTAPAARARHGGGLALAWAAARFALSAVLMPLRFFVFMTSGLTAGIVGSSRRTTLSGAATPAAAAMTTAVLAPAGVVQARRGAQRTDQQRQQARGGPAGGGDAFRVSQLRPRHLRLPPMAAASPVVVRPRMLDASHRGAGRGVAAAPPSLSSSDVEGASNSAESRADRAQPRLGFEQPRGTLAAPPASAGGVEAPGSVHPSSRPAGARPEATGPQALAGAPSLGRINAQLDAATDQLLAALRHVDAFASSLRSDTTAAASSPAGASGNTASTAVPAADTAERRGLAPLRGADSRQPTAVAPVGPSAGPVAAPSHSSATTVRRDALLDLLDRWTAAAATAAATAGATGAAAAVTAASAPFAAPVAASASAAAVPSATAAVTTATATTTTTAARATTTARATATTTTTARATTTAARAAAAVAADDEDDMPPLASDADSEEEDWYELASARRLGGLGGATRGRQQPPPALRPPPSASVFARHSSVHRSLPVLSRGFASPQVPVPPLPPHLVPPRVPGEQSSASTPQAPSHSAAASSTPRRSPTGIDDDLSREDTAGNQRRLQSNPTSASSAEASSTRRGGAASVALQSQGWQAGADTGTGTGAGAGAGVRRRLAWQPTAEADADLGTDGEADRESTSSAPGPITNPSPLHLERLLGLGAFRSPGLTSTGGVPAGGGVSHQVSYSTPTRGPSRLAASAEGSGATAAAAIQARSQAQAAGLAGRSVAGGDRLAALFSPPRPFGSARALLHRPIGAAAPGPGQRLPTREPPQPVAAAAEAPTRSRLQRQTGSAQGPSAAAAGSDTGSAAGSRLDVGGLGEPQNTTVTAAVGPRTAGAAAAPRSGALVASMLSTLQNYRGLHDYARASVWRSRLLIRRVGSMEDLTASPDPVLSPVRTASPESAGMQHQQRQRQQQQPQAALLVTPTRSGAGAFQAVGRSTQWLLPLPPRPGSEVVSAPGGVGAGAGGVLGGRVTGSAAQGTTTGAGPSTSAGEANVRVGERLPYGSLRGLAAAATATAAGGTPASGVWDGTDSEEERERRLFAASGLAGAEPAALDGAEGMAAAGPEADDGRWARSRRSQGNQQRRRRQRARGQSRGWEDDPDNPANPGSLWRYYYSDGNTDHRAVSDQTRRSEAANSFSFHLGDSLFRGLPLLDRSLDMGIGTGGEGRGWRHRLDSILTPPLLRSRIDRFSLDTRPGPRPAPRAVPERATPSESDGDSTGGSTRPDDLPGLLSDYDEDLSPGERAEQRRQWQLQDEASRRERRRRRRRQRRQQQQRMEAAAPAAAPQEAPQPTAEHRPPGPATGLHGNDTARAAALPATTATLVPAAGRDGATPDAGSTRANGGVNVRVFVLPPGDTETEDETNGGGASSSVAGAGRQRQDACAANGNAAAAAAADSENEGEDEDARLANIASRLFDLTCPEFDWADVVPAAATNATPPHPDSRSQGQDPERNASREQVACTPGGAAAAQQSATAATERPLSVPPLEDCSDSDDSVFEHPAHDNLAGAPPGLLSDSSGSESAADSVSTSRGSGATPAAVPGSSAHTAATSADGTAACNGVSDNARRRGSGGSSVLLPGPLSDSDSGGSSSVSSASQAGLRMYEAFLAAAPEVPELPVLEPRPNGGGGGGYGGHSDHVPPPRASDPGSTSDGPSGAASSAVEWWNLPPGRYDEDVDSPLRREVHPLLGMGGLSDGELSSYEGFEEGEEDGWHRLMRAAHPSESELERSGEDDSEGSSGVPPLVTESSEEASEEGTESPAGDGSSSDEGMPDLMSSGEGSNLGGAAADESRRRVRARRTAPPAAPPRASAQQPGASQRADSIDSLSTRSSPTRGATVSPPSSRFTEAARRAVRGGAAATAAGAGAWLDADTTPATQQLTSSSNTGSRAATRPGRWGPPAGVNLRYAEASDGGSSDGMPALLPDSGCSSGEERVRRSAQRQQARRQPLVETPSVPVPRPAATAAAPARARGGSAAPAAGGGGSSTNTNRPPRLELGAAAEAVLDALMPALLDAYNLGGGTSGSAPPASGQGTAGGGGPAAARAARPRAAPQILSAVIQMPAEALSNVPHGSVFSITLPADGSGSGAGGVGGNGGGGAGLAAGTVRLQLGGVTSIPMSWRSYLPPEDTSGRHPNDRPWLPGTYEEGEIPAWATRFGPPRPMPAAAVVADQAEAAAAAVSGSSGVEAAEGAGASLAAPARNDTRNDSGGRTASRQDVLPALWDDFSVDGSTDEDTDLDQHDGSTPPDSDDDGNMPPLVRELESDDDFDLPPLVADSHSDDDSLPPLARDSESDDDETLPPLARDSESYDEGSLPPLARDSESYDEGSLPPLARDTDSDDDESLPPLARDSESDDGSIPPLVPNDDLWQPHGGLRNNSAGGAAATTATAGTSSGTGAGSGPSAAPAAEGTSDAADAAAASAGGAAGSGASAAAAPLAAAVTGADAVHLPASRSGSEEPAGPPGLYSRSSSLGSSVIARMMSDLSWAAEVLPAPADGDLGLEGPAAAEAPAPPPAAAPAAVAGDPVQDNSVEIGTPAHSEQAGGAAPAAAGRLEPAWGLHPHDFFPEIFPDRSDPPRPAIGVPLRTLREPQLRQQQQQQQPVLREIHSAGPVLQHAAAVANPEAMAAPLSGVAGESAEREGRNQRGGSAPARVPLPPMPPGDGAAPASSAPSTISRFVGTAAEIAAVDAVLPASWMLPGLAPGTGSTAAGGGSEAGAQGAQGAGVPPLFPTTRSVPIRRNAVTYPRGVLLEMLESLRNVGGAALGPGGGAGGGSTRGAAAGASGAESGLGSRAVGVFAGAGASGVSSGRRPALAALLRDAEFVERLLGGLSDVASDPPALFVQETVRWLSGPEAGARL